MKNKQFFVHNTIFSPEDMLDYFHARAAALGFSNGEASLLFYEAIINDDEEAIQFLIKRGIAWKEHGDHA